MTTELLHYADDLNTQIERLKEPFDTKNEQTKAKEHLAASLNMSSRGINRLLKRANVSIPPSKTVEMRQKQREIVQIRRNMHNLCALEFIEGSVTVVEAAEDAGVSTRQMYRIIDKLCTAVGVNYRDLKRTTLENRHHVAQLTRDWSKSYET